MSHAVSVRPIASQNEKKVFVEFPWKAYKNDPDWVPPLLSMRWEKLDVQKNPLLAHLDIEFFIAWRGEEPVGTIAAFINHQHNKFHNENIGWFGMFELVDDREVADALLQTAEAWVKGKGYDGIRGPASYGDLDEFGMLVDYFGGPHVILMAYNPEYYKTYLEAAGYRGVMDMLSYEIASSSLLGDDISPRIRRVVEKQRKRRNIVLRKPDMKNFNHEIEVMMELYLQAWNDNWGFVPPTREEMFYVVNQMKMFIEKDLMIIAEIENQPVGFIVLLPDLNQVLKHANPQPGVPEWFTMLKVLWHWKVAKKVNRVRVPFLGVLEEYRGMGIDAMLYMEVLEPAIKRGYTVGDFGWVLDDNVAMNQIGDLLKADVYKRYRIYHKDFNGGQSQ